MIVDSPPLQGLTADAINALKSDLRIARMLFSACKEELEMICAPLARQRLANTHLKAIFATAAANAFAPYGNSIAIDYDDIALEPALNCLNYTALLHHLLSALRVSQRARLTFAGFDGGAVKNHANGFFRYQGVELLLDPTTSIVAATSLESVLRGQPVPRNLMVCFHRKDDFVIEEFRGLVWSALREGKYRPADLLYHFGEYRDWEAAMMNFMAAAEIDRAKALKQFEIPAVARYLCVG